MPINSIPRPSEPHKAAIDANRLGTALRAQGRLSEAAEAFAQGIRAQDDRLELHLNLAIALTELGRFDDARSHYERVLELDPQDTAAHLALYELDQMAGRRTQALEHQAAALARQTSFSVYAPQQQRRLAVLMAPGDWQANVPVDYLLDARTTTVHKIYLTSQPQALSLMLPDADVVFTAIAQSPDNADALRWAASSSDRSALPHLNAPANVAAADRASVYKTLQAIEHVRVPETLERSREELAAQAPAFPAVVRPVGSQAGRDLAKVQSARELDEYLQAVEGRAFYVMPFINYAAPDGYFRKYRLFVVGGKPYPCHLGISRDWMIHYYNAPMRENAWMREEEQRLLEDFETVFPPQLRRAACDIAAALQLDYLGLDCTIDADGNLLLFEADPAMIVHAADDPALFAYKHAAARAIFAAFSELVDRARSG